MEEKKRRRKKDMRKKRTTPKEIGIKKNAEPKAALVGAPIPLPQKK